MSANRLGPTGEELAILEARLAAIWDNVLGGDLDAIDEALAIMERESRLLGLYRSNHEQTVPEIHD